MSQRPQNFVINPRHSLAQGLVFTWLGIGVRSNIVYDSSLNRKNGIPYTLPIATSYPWSRDLGRYCIYGRADVDAVTQPYIKLPDLSKYFTNQATFACWIKCDNLGAWNNKYSGLMNFYNTSTKSHYPYSTTTMYIGWFSTVRKLDGVAITWPITQWHHIAVRTKSGTDNYQFLLNGKVVYTRNGDATVAMPTNCKLMQNHYTLDSYAFNDSLRGCIADPVLYNRFLSDKEMSILANRYDANLDGLVTNRLGKKVFPVELPYRVDRQKKLLLGSIKRHTLAYSELAHANNSISQTVLEAHGGVAQDIVQPLDNLGNVKHYDTTSCVVLKEVMHRRYIPTSKKQGYARISLNKFKQTRPSNFILNPFHPLARGLVFAGLGRNTKGTTYLDSSLRRNHGQLVNMDPATDWGRDIGRATLDLVGASSQSIIIPAAVVSAVPLTMSCWFKAPNVTSAQSLVEISAGTTTRFLLYVQAGGARFQTSSKVASSTGAAVNTWVHAVGVTAATNSRFAYTNGVSGAENTANSTPSNLRTTWIGGDAESGGGLYLTGLIADPCIWNRALSRGEISALADPSNVMLNGLLLDAHKSIFTYDIEYEDQISFPIEYVVTQDVGFFSNQVMPITYNLAKARNLTINTDHRLLLAKLATLVEEAAQQVASGETLPVELKADITRLFDSLPTSWKLLLSRSISEPVGYELNISDNFEFGTEFTRFLQDNNIVPIEHGLAVEATGLSRDFILVIERILGIADGTILNYGSIAQLVQSGILTQEQGLQLARSGQLDVEVIKNLEHSKQVTVDNLTNDSFDLTINDEALLDIHNSEAFNVDYFNALISTLNVRCNIEWVANLHSTSQTPLESNLAAFFSNIILNYEYRGRNVGPSGIWVLDARNTMWYLDSRGNVWTLSRRN